MLYQLIQKYQITSKKKESDPSKKAPKEWWDKMVKKVKAGNPSYDEETVRKTVGKIWSDLPVTKKKTIRGRYGKKYGKAPTKKVAANVLELLATKYEIKAKDTITVIDFKQSIDKIKNFKDLPKNVQDAIKSADHIESKGFQELLGYKENKIIWSAGGHWDGRKNIPSEKFVVENFGGATCPHCNQTIQWSGR